MKQALCVPITAVPSEMIETRDRGNAAVFDRYSMVNKVLCVNPRDLTLEDRRYCETDETKLQLIPYIVVRSHDGHIFAYSRGGKSEEDRLKSKMSIGLGGHIESAPVNNIEGAGLIQHIKIEAARELKEEIGVELPTREIRIEGLLISGVVEVDRVHLGVYCSVRLSADTQMQFEHQVIEKGQFHHYADLMNTEMLSRMEVWSRLVLTRGFDPM